MVILILLTLLAVTFATLLQRTNAAADALIAQREEAFAAVPPFTSAEARQLRRFLNPEHVARARALGIERLPDRSAAALLTADTSADAPLRPVKTNTRYAVNAQMRYGVPYVVPAMRRLLDLVGLRFQEALRARGMPPYRYLITSALRTTADQVALRAVNHNAASGVSSHEFGTTVDLHYERFDYVPQNDSLPSGSRLYEPLLAWRVTRASTRLGVQHPRALKAVLADVLTQLQAEGKVMVIYERRQPVFHVTVAAPV